jgi:enterochelin esterase-like enzyme
MTRLGSGPKRGLGSWPLPRLVALGLLVVGLVGAYSYAQAYSQHRGFVTLARLPRAGRGRLLSVNFYSPALHREAYYLTYLPAGYSPFRHYPVFYLLHGMPGRPQVWIDIANMDVRLDNQLSQHHLRPMILVFPDGRIGGSTYSDSEWANTRAGNYESYVLDVVNDVDHRFATLPERRDRLIAGFSAGAYGAINIALHHLQEFGSVQVWSGYFTQSRSGVFAHASKASLVNNSPIDYVGGLRQQLAADPLRVFIFVGRDDAASRQIVPMSRALSAAGASVRYAIYRGGHDWQVWYPRLNQMLIQASRDFGHTPPRSLAPPPSASHRHQASTDRRHRRHLARAAWAHQHQHARAQHPRAQHADVQHTRAQHARAQHARHRASRGTGRARPPVVVSPTPGAAVPAPPRRPARHPGELLGGLLLALLSAAAINLGFLLQHRGLVSTPAVARKPLLLLRNRSWLAGQAIGWIGFGAQIIAVALAPLSLVQAFAAGGLALSVPLAAGFFRHRVSRSQALAVLAIAVSLALLPLGLSARRSELHAGILIFSSAAMLAVGIGLGLQRRPALRALAAGIFYGVADAAIKADSVNIRGHGAGALLSGWTMLALLSTFGGFLAFQAALRTGNPVSAISAMTAVTALTALAFGLLAFGESLGTTPAAATVHGLAIVCVLVCVPRLAGAQQDIADAVQIPQAQHSPPRPGRARIEVTPAPLRALLAIGRGAAFATMLVLSLLAGIGLLYALRGMQWLGAGSPVRDSLPLLQLAGFDSQPILRVAVAFLPAGVILALVPVRISPLRRIVAATVVGMLLLLLASDASFALARNLRLGAVLSGRLPGLGPLLEGLLFAVGCALPVLIARIWPAVQERLFGARGAVFSRS